MAYFIGVEVGGTQLRAGLLSTDRPYGRKPRLLGRVGQPQSLENLQPPDAVSRIVSLAKQCVASAGQELEQQVTSGTSSTITPADIVGIGIAIPDAVHPNTGRVESPTLLRTWRRVPIADLLEDALSKEFGANIMVVVGNDANMAAWGEYKVGEGRASGATQLVFLMVSTGIGAGIIANDALYLGAQGFAGEFGHVMIEPQHHEICGGCHQHGCLEVLASGVAIAKGGARTVSTTGAPRILNAMYAQQRSVNLDIGGEWAETTAQTPQGQAVNALAVIDAAEQGDQDATEVVTAAGRYLGQGLVQILHGLNPAVIVLGGGVPCASNVYVDAAIEEARRHALPTPFNGCHIVTPLLGTDATLLGAALKAEEEVLGQAALVGNDKA